MYEVIKANLTLTGMVVWLNDSELEKDADKTKFTTGDVQQYIRLGHLPYYMGGYKIEKVENRYAKLYNIVRDPYTNIEP